MSKSVVRTSLGPPAMGAYSQAIISGNMIFVSGQIPLDPATGNLIAEKDIKSQTRRALLNLQGIVRQARRIGPEEITGQRNEENACRSDRPR